jgi:hypothetical protein
MEPKTVRRAITGLIAIALWAALAQRADADAFNYYYDDAARFALYGQQDNFSGWFATAGACAAVAAINSFIFLERTHSGLYGNSLTPSRIGDANTDFTDAFAFTEGTWQVGSNPERIGYYARFPGDPNGLYVNTKMDWINDHAPGTTIFDFRFVGEGGHPDVAWFANEIANGEDVEFFVNNDDGTFYHGLTLTGIACDAAGNCFITYSDPNDPTMMFNRALSIGVGGRLEFNNPFGLEGTVFIDAAFSESAVPAPSTIFLLAAGIGGLMAVVTIRQKRGEVRSRAET